jgi:hypothetical protein
VHQWRRRASERDLLFFPDKFEIQHHIIGGIFVIIRSPTISLQSWSRYQKQKAWSNSGLRQSQVLDCKNRLSTNIEITIESQTRDLPHYEELPILYPHHHALPRCLLPYLIDHEIPHHTLAVTYGQSHQQVHLRRQCRELRVYLDSMRQGSF